MTFEETYITALKLSSMGLLDRLPDALANAGMHEEEIDAAVQLAHEALEPRAPEIGPDILAKQRNDWYKTTKYPDRDNWSRYLDLLFRKGWKADPTIRSINYTSTGILNLMTDPATTADCWHTYGLVVGYVQSGKTANFTAVIGKAVDAGYNVIIVLAGLHNDLRSQTQARLDKELTGKAKDPNGHHVDQPTVTWVDLTERDEHGDFHEIGDVSLLDRDGPVLLVVKKRCSVLEKLDNWLGGMEDQSDVAKRLLQGKKLLLVDDEADYAGVNTGRDSDEAPEIDDVDEEVDPDEALDTDPSRTNELIRRVLTHFKKRCYVGYTATPFANVLIDPFGRPGDEHGPTLYPRDFIYALPPPEGYIGTEAYFPFGADEAEYQARGVRLVSQEHANIVRDGGVDADEANDELPCSLKDAMLDFILTLAARTHRGMGSQPHHSMLIHAHHQVDVQNALYCKVERLWGIWREELLELSDAPLTPGAIQLEASLQRRWQAEFVAMNPNTETWEEIRPHFREAASVVITVVNSRTPGPKNLEFLADEAPPLLKYDDHPAGLKVIAIGGNRLSRGLTLEGLTVTYFVRPARMYDTLLQMGRWFGFRPNYRDLVRVHLTEQLRSWFSHLAEVERQIRADISRYSAEDRSPIDLAVRVLTHPEANGLMPTSPAKRRHAREMRLGWDGTTTQSLHFHLDDIGLLKMNLGHTKDLVAELGDPSEKSQLLWIDVRGDVVLQYLRSLAFPTITGGTFDQTLVTQYIEKRLADGELDGWSIFIPSNSQGNPLPVEAIGHSFGMPTRSRIKGEQSIGVLSDPAHFYVDLPGVYQTTSAMLDARDVQRGLLVIYILDKDSKGNSEGRVDLFDGYENSSREHVVGVAFVFPRSESAEKNSYMVVKGICHE